jgi:hypothetical protein
MKDRNGRALANGVVEMSMSQHFMSCMNFTIGTQEAFQNTVMDSAAKSQQ